MNDIATVGQVLIATIMGAYAGTAMIVCVFGLGWLIFFKSKCPHCGRER